MPLTSESTNGIKKVTEDLESHFLDQHDDYLTNDSGEIYLKGDAIQMLTSDRVDLTTLDHDSASSGQPNSISSHLILILSMILVMQALLSHI